MAEEIRKFGTPEGLQVLPCAPDVCQDCAVDHPPDQPHNAQSLYYLYAFYAKHGRWPTWKDAVAHCAPEVREAWEAALKERGAWSEPKEEAADAPA